MHIPCFMLSRIVVPSWWILSNHLDFSNHNFVTKLPNPGSLKLPTINCFLRRELLLGKLFHWQFVFTKIWYNQKQPCTARPKILSCCDEIMLRDEITGFDGSVPYLFVLFSCFSVQAEVINYSGDLNTPPDEAAKVKRTNFIGKKKVKGRGARDDDSDDENDWW